MPVSASKLVTLAQLQAQAERVKQELAKYTLASELGSLAKKSEISEADLSAALKSVIDGKMDAADSMTTEAINSAIATAIAKSAHARFEKVEKVPSNDESQDNVLYLVMNAATGYYDIYAKVGEKVVRLDDTTVDLSNYATIEQLNAVSGGIGGTVYAGTKEDLSASDDSVIAAYFKAHTDVAVKKGDVFVVTTTVGNSTYEKSAYFYDGKAWVAMTGNVDADKVILRENITLAGGYTQVGNLTKSQNGTATFSTKGKSVMDALTEIFSKRLQPSSTAQPSIGTFTLTGAGAVEAGTKVAAAAYSGATLNAGSYQYGPATGVTATNWKVERITDKATTEVANAETASLAAGSDNNGGAGFVIGDAGGDAVASLKYKATATHGAGVTAKDNLGAASSPVVAIAAGSKTKDTAAYTPFRNVFYGASTSKPALDSAAIRALGKTGKAYAAGTLTINVPVGAQRVAIACIATAKGVTKDINDSLKTCEDHVQSAHAPANAEENVIVSIQRNGQAIPPDNKVVNIEVPTKTSTLENDSGYATTEDVEEKVNGAGHLKAVPVDALPAPSEANADTIYFLRKNNSEAGKQYRAYKLIHGIFEIVGSAEVDLTSYATRESVAKADDDLIKGIYNNMTASSEKYLGSGNLLLFWTLLKSLLNGHESSINDLLARVKLLELILSADVTGNPYYVTFNTLTDVVVSSGIWNESDGRIEF